MLQKFENTLSKSNSIQLESKLRVTVIEIQNQIALTEKRPTLYMYKVIFTYNIISSTYFNALYYYTIIEDIAIIVYIYHKIDSIKHSF